MNDEISVMAQNCYNQVVIPNVFTPIGDGVNDLFLLEFIGSTSVEGKIFNRGQAVYNWHGTKGSWDGYIHPSGLTAPDGVYYYIFKVTNGTEENHHYSRKEFSYTKFQRSFTIPKNVNIQEIKGDYNDGILKVHIPKKTDEKMKKTISID